MALYDLALTPDYVKSWTLNDAFRELIQNGIDQESIDPNNKFFLEYNEETKTLRFINKYSKLGIESLRLGFTTKSDCDKTVGQFGEGYKIASLVLLREGKTFTVCNGNRDEVWTANFKKSPKWKSEILQFEVKKRVDEKTFYFEVGNVEQDEYDAISEIWLGWESGYDDISHVQTDYGKILTEDWCSNQIFVNGLFVTELDDLKFGYDFKPEYLKLERDRKTPDEWNAKIITAQMLAQAVSRGYLEDSEIITMIKEDRTDVYNSDLCGNRETFVKMVINDFDKRNENSIPVQSQEDYDKVKYYGGNPVYIEHRAYSLVGSIARERMDELMKNASVEATSLHDKFQIWFSTYCTYIRDGGKEEFEKLLKKLE